MREEYAFVNCYNALKYAFVKCNALKYAFVKCKNYA